MAGTKRVARAIQSAIGKLIFDFKMGFRWVLVQKVQFFLTLSGCMPIFRSFKGYQRNI